MKIAILIQSMQTGGIQRVAVDQMRELERRGHEAHLITFIPEPEGDSLMESVSVPAERRHYVSYPRMRSMRGLMETKRLLKDLKLDVVITHHWFANTVGRVAAYFAGVRSVITFEHSVYDTHKPPRQLFYDRLLQNWCKHIVAVSEAVKDSLVRNGIRAERITVLANGINLSRFTPHAFSEGPVRLLSVGRLVGDKGIDVLIAAMKKTSGVTLRIVGEGPERGVLEKSVRESGLSDRISFLGARNDIPQLLVEADALVLPSRREGFGLVAVEARASGVPVVASDLPALRDIVQDGVNGLLVTPDNAGALSQAIKKITEDTELRRRLSAQAPHDLSRFSIAVHTDTLLTLCKN